LGYIQLFYECFDGVWLDDTKGNYSSLQSPTQQQQQQPQQQQQQSNTAV